VGRTVLLIEEDADVRRRVTKYLEEAGFSVVAVSESESALLGFEYIAPDVVLVAYPIGGRASDDVAAWVRNSSRPATPVVAMFPFPQRRVAMKALADGCVDVIPKPVDRLLLEDLVKGLLQPRAAPRRDPSKDIRIAS